MPDVDFVLNCYERTYRDVLEPGFVAGLAASCAFDFASITVLINNVVDEADVRRRAAHLVAEDPQITRVEWVAEHLPSALHRVGLRPRHIRRLPHFSDCALVATCLSGPEWMVYWDAEAVLREPGDWVSPLLAFMATNPEVVVGSPNNWHDDGRLASREALRVDGDIAVGFGFSDVAFLARRDALARPIYRKMAPASWRFPLSSTEPIFEQRVDAWMRRTGRQRATHLPVVVTHPNDAGVNYPRVGVREALRARAFHHLGSVARRASAHPACRPWPDEASADSS